MTLRQPSDGSFAHPNIAAGCMALVVYMTYKDSMSWSAPSLREFDASMVRTHKAHDGIGCQRRNSCHEVAPMNASAVASLAWMVGLS